MTRPPPPTGPLVVGIGEVLFDCFEDRKYLGGAPANLAVHADQLFRRVGGRGMIASRVGKDPLGQQLVAEIASRGMSLGHLQIDSQLPTGSVRVSLDSEDQPQYEIMPDTAWDNLEFTSSWQKLARRCDAVCFGTLAQRSLRSRHTIHHFLKDADTAWRICDLNLRQNFFDALLIEQCFQTANVVKLNQEELATANRLLKIDTSSKLAVEDLAAKFSQKFKLELLALTRAAEGTLLFRGNQRGEAAPCSYPTEAGADSVGAGDACCAALIFGLHQEWSLEQIVKLANRVGAYVASRRGATPLLPADILGESN